MAKIAVIGTGISGLGSAYLLNPANDVTVYEKQDRIGGHTRTVTIDYDGKEIAVDTGFIVFNRPNYPNLSGMFDHLDVPTHASNMTFAASIGNGWLEYGAADLNTLFGQRRNLLRPKYLGLLRDVGTFHSKAQETVERHPHFTVRELLDHLGMGEWFRQYYLLPVSGAIWSCPPAQMQEFPARSLIRFFANHHLLSFSGQPQWHTVTGGAKEYVRRLTKDFAEQIRTGCSAVEVTRPTSGKDAGKVQVRDSQGGVETYDQVVMASHGDETLALLSDADARERDALQHFHYQKNVAVLHRDTSLMPTRRRCWASWVYTSDGAFDHPKITVSYWMNRLQGIDNRHPLFVSLNPAREIPAHLVFDTATFDHPVFDTQAVAAQDRVAALQGARNTWFAGAHLRHGFHEDGLASAVAVARGLRAPIPWITPDPKTGTVPQKAHAPLAGYPTPVPAELF